jgi:RecJ-like exonuclease
VSNLFIFLFADFDFTIIIDIHKERRKLQLKDINDVPRELLNRLKKAKDIILSEKGIVRVISHYDADGICAAGIMSNTLNRQKIKFHVTLTRSLSDEFVDILKKEDYPVSVFCDMGSGHLKSLSEFTGKVIVLDHHVAQEDSQNPLLINPHIFGINGTDEICASSLAFFWASLVNEDYWDLSALALAGLIGDKQHLNGLLGYNAYLVDIALKKGIVEKRRSLKFGSSKIKTSLMEDLDPFIANLTAREDKILEFLNEMNMDSDTKVEDLDVSQRRLLSSAIMIKLLGRHLRPEIVEGIITNKYWLPKWKLFATDLSNYVNSCGRMDQMGVGLALCLGDERALEKAKELRKIYKDKLRKGILRLETEGAHQKNNIQFFYCENPSLAGAHAGLGMMYLFDQEKPVIALSVVESETKISSRGTKYLVSKGLDLAFACRKAANEIGGRGGGHPVASGATIPKGKEEAFLELVDDIVFSQFHAKDKEPEKSDTARQ